MVKGPAYWNVYEAIKRNITEGEFAVGGLLPTEPELEKRFGVSRTTVRRAVELLSREGFVQAKQGRGTLVLDYKTRQNLNRVTSITETLTAKGFDVRPKNVHLDLISGGVIAQELGLDETQPIVRIQRIQLADGAPLAVMKNYIAASLVPGIEHHAENIISFYRFLEEHYALFIDSAYDRITARSAAFAEAEMLEMPMGAAVLCIRRICTRQNQPVCLDVSVISGNKYELELNMTGR